MERYITVRTDVQYTKSKFNDDVYDFESTTGTHLRFRFVTKTHQVNNFMCPCKEVEHKRGYLSVIIDEGIEYPIAEYDLDADVDCKNSWKDIERIVKLETKDDVYTIQKSSGILIRNDITYYSTVEKDTTMETLTQIGFTCIGKIQILKSLFILMPDGIYKQIVNHTRKSGVFIKNLEVYTMEEFEATDENKLKGGNIVIKL